MKPPEPDPAFEVSLRPPMFSEFTGQVKTTLRGTNALLDADAAMTAMRQRGALVATGRRPREALRAHREGRTAARAAEASSCPCRFVRLESRAAAPSRPTVRSAHPMPSAPGSTRE